PASPRAMGTAAPVAHAEAVGEGPAIALLRHLWKWLWPPDVELALANEAEAPVLTFMDRLRKFLWLSSGLFSAAAFAVPAIGVIAAPDHRDAEERVVLHRLFECRRPGVPVRGGPNLRQRDESSVQRHAG